MFFASAERIRAMRELIGAAELTRSAEDEEEEEEGRGSENTGNNGNNSSNARAMAASAAALSKLKDFQREDFAGIFREMRGAPVVIRTLDPPLHEFLPAEGPALDELVSSLAKLLAVSREVRGRIFFVFCLLLCFVFFAFFFLHSFFYKKDGRRREREETRTRRNKKRDSPRISLPLSFLFLDGNELKN